MRPPEFWHHRHGRASAPMLRLLLTPFSALYAAATARRIAHTTPLRLPVPVISVGNLTVGGTGKTPLVRHIRALLRAEGIAAAALSRGYGGRLKGPLAVDPATHTAADVGDEPLLLAADGPVWISRDRAEGGRAAVAAGIGALVLDDGHQNPALAKDLSLVVIDATAGFGNGAIFPAGPLREPVKAGLSRADALILMRDGPDDTAWPLEDLPPDDLPWDGPRFNAWLAPASGCPRGPLVAFCGIGRPQKFADTLTALGAQVTDIVPFPDHHPFTSAELDRLQDLATDRGATLVTTEKDATRLPLDWRARVQVVRVATQFADPEGFARLVLGAVAARRSTGAPERA